MTYALHLGMTDAFRRDHLRNDSAAILSCPKRSDIYIAWPYLEMQVVHSAICSQRIEGQAEEGVVSFMRKLKRQLQ